MFVLIRSCRTPCSPSTFLGGLRSRVFHTQSWTHTTFFCVDTHHKRRVDFSLLPESQLYLLLHCRMHSGEADQSVVLFPGNKRGAAHQIHRAKSPSVAEPRPDGTLSAARGSAGVTVGRLQGFCNLLSLELSYRNFRFYRLTCCHVLAVVWRWILWGTFTAQVFHLSHWFEGWNLCSRCRGESVCVCVCKLSINISHFYSCNLQ